MAERPRPDHVLVVGGGISGLVAALRLTQGGVEVTLVEPGPLGGKLQTSEVAGRLVDETADAFLLRVPWALALCHDLELEAELVSPAERNAHVYCGGVRHPIPAGHVLGVPTDLEALAASGLISAAGVEQARQDLVLPPDPTDPTGGGPDVAIGAYLRRRLGDEVVDHLVDPLLGGINAGDTATMSMAAVVAQLDAAARTEDPSLIRSLIAQRERAAAGGGASSAAPATVPAGSSGAGAVVAAVDAEPAAPPIFATPLGGMARIIDALAGFLPAADIRQGRRVEGLELHGRSGSCVRATLDDGSAVEADAVIVATPAHVAGPLLRAVAPAAAATLEAIDHSSIAMATVAFERHDLGDVDGASGCLIPRDQGTLVTAISYATSKWAQLRDPDRDDVILRTSVGRTGDRRFQDLDDRDLTEAILADLDAVLGVRGAPTDVRIGRWDRSFPQYAPGHLDRVDALEADLAETPVSMAGMALRGVGIPACVHSAEQAVARLGVQWPTRRSLAT